MQPLRHAVLLRLVALLVGVGVLGTLVPVASAAPARRVAGWLREQAAGADAAALDAALDVVLAGQPQAVADFFVAYAAAQPRFGAPTGAWFGLDGLTFDEALRRMQAAAPSDLSAPLERTAVGTAAQVASAPPASDLGLWLVHRGVRVAGVRASVPSEGAGAARAVPQRPWRRLGPARAP